MGGINLYAFSGNAATNNIDILGNDFITAGSNRAIDLSGNGKGDVPMIGHLSLIYWKDTKKCIRRRDFSIRSIQKDAGWIRIPEGPSWGGYPSVMSDGTKSDVVQLGFDPFITSHTETASTYTVGIGPTYTIRTIEDSVNLSVVKFSPDGNADEFVVIYADTPEVSDSSVKWEVLKAAARSYAYAEHAPDENGFPDGYAAKNWPNSKYGIFINGTSNNSNTFAREMARSIGETIDESLLSRPHPGNQTPQPVSDSRPVPVYRKSR
jgi:hypothetical protein